MPNVRKINVFSGIRPRFPDSLLPEHTASIARNCDFAYGELRNTRGGLAVSSTTNIAKSIYTDDGLTFYTWDRDVDAVRAPMVSDSLARMYYTDNGVLRVASRNGTRTNGGEPSTSYKVGVPRPTVPPVLSIPALPDLSTLDIVWWFHYEASGVKYQEQAIFPTVVIANDSWKYTPPVMATGAAIEPFTYKVTKYVRTYENPAWATLPTYNSQYLTETVVLPANTYIKILSASNVEIRKPGQPNYSVSGVTNFLDENGLAHEVESLFSMQKYGFIKDQEVQISTRTPIDAVPVFRAKATNKTDGAPVFDIYTSNSSFSDGNALWELLSSKSTTTGEFTIQINRGIKEEDKETRAYVYCYVNLYGEPGPPSDPTMVVTSPVIDVDVTVKLDGVSADGFVPIKEIWVYRTPSGSTIADYFFVESIPVLTGGPTFSFRDNLKGAELNEPLSSDFYYPPPTGLGGLMSLPNGILCAWKDNELWFAEAFRPWAWPPSYCKVLSNKIIGGIPHGSGAVVTTTQSPYIVSGVSPDSMTASRLNVTQAGVSKWSIAAVDGYVVYASHDGLVSLSGAAASLDQSEQFFTRDTWRERYKQGLASMRFAVWDGRLIVFSSEDKFTPFMIRMDEAAGSMTDLPDLKASCAFVSHLSDQCYYANGSWVYQFNGGNDQDAVWQSRELVEAAPLNFGFAQIVATGTWTISFYADGVLRHEESAATGTKGFRLPSGFLSDRWKVKVSGRGRLRELAFAKTAADLKNG